MALGTTLPLTEMITRNLPEGNRHLGLITSLPSVNRLTRKCGSLDVSQTYGSPRRVKRISWRARLTTSPSFMSRLSRKCGSLDVSQPYGSPRRVKPISWRARLTTSPSSVSRSSRKCGSLDVSQHYMRICRTHKKHDICLRL
jgi:hypothetical protein